MLPKVVMKLFFKKNYFRMIQRILGRRHFDFLPNNVAYVRGVTVRRVTFLINNIMDNKVTSRTKGR